MLGLSLQWSKLDREDVAWLFSISPLVRLWAFVSHSKGVMIGHVELRIVDALGHDRFPIQQVVFVMFVGMVRMIVTCAVFSRGRLACRICMLT